MQKIIQITGKVQHSITLDPTLWIFDDRRIDLNEFFTEGYVEKDELTEYMKNIGKHWSREIMEGATFPPTLETEKAFEQSKEITGTYGIYLHYFVKNAVPLEEAKTITFETSSGQQHAFPIDLLDQFILKYSIDGKPIIEDGPVHVIHKDGSNLESPITHVVTVLVS